MEFGKFIISGQDKKTLASVKNALASSGYIFLGYLKEPMDIIRHVRRHTPDFLIIEVCNNFRDIRADLEVIDEEILAACVLIVDSRDDEIFSFVKNSRVMTYITKPIFDESILQVVDISLINFRRVVEYEHKVKELNDTLESRKAIEKAKWILVEQKGISEDEAYKIIKKKSRDNRMPMRNIAEALILTRG